MTPNAKVNQPASPKKLLKPIKGFNSKDEKLTEKSIRRGSIKPTQKVAPKIKRKDDDITHHFSALRSNLYKAGSKNFHICQMQYGKDANKAMTNANFSCIIKTSIGAK
jgi:regulator of replication initiation timing